MKYLHKVTGHRAQLQKHLIGNLVLNFSYVPLAGSAIFIHPIMKPYPAKARQKPLRRHQCNGQDTKRKKQAAARLSGSKILLESTLVLLLFCGRLEGAVSELGRSVDPLEVDLLQGTTRGVGEHGLAESHDTLLNTRNRALNHDEVIVDLTIADESTQTIRIC